MKVRLFRVKFNIDYSEMSNQFDNMSDVQKEVIHNLDVKSTFEHDGTEQTYMCYMLTNITQIELYKNILNQNLIPYICDDISEDVINGDIDLEYDLDPFLDHLNYLSYDGFIYDVNRWIYNNIDLDMILDNISRRGMANLRPIEKEYLKDYSND